MEGLELLSFVEALGNLGPSSNQKYFKSKSRGKKFQRGKKKEIVIHHQIYHFGGGYCHWLEMNYYETSNYDV